MAGARCPTCDTLVPPGKERCPQCGRVFGEANRCPHCHAIAAARPSGRGFVCVACGKPRTLEPGTTLAGGTPDAQGRSRPRQLGLRALGGLLLSVSVIGAALSTALLGTGLIGIATAALVATLGIFGAIRVLRHASSLEEQLDQHAEASRAELAKQVLLERSSTVPELAATLGTSEREADALATRLAADDASGISAEVDEAEGVLRFGPRRASVAPVRVEDPDDGAVGADQDEGDGEAADSSQEQSVRRE